MGHVIGYVGGFPLFMAFAGEVLNFVEIIISLVSICSSAMYDLGGSCFWGCSIV